MYTTKGSGQPQSKEDSTMTNKTERQISEMKNQTIGV